MTLAFWEQSPRRVGDTDTLPGLCHTRVVFVVSTEVETSLAIRTEPRRKKVRDLTRALPRRSPVSKTGNAVHPPASPHGVFSTPVEMTEAHRQFVVSSEVESEHSGSRFLGTATDHVWWPWPFVNLGPALVLSLRSPRADKFHEEMLVRFNQQPQKHSHDAARRSVGTT